MHVLLLDDSHIVRGQLDRLLSAVEGVKRVTEAEDTDNALDLASRLEPDLIILDLELGDPDRDGLQLLESLAGRANPPKAVVFSNHPELRDHALAAGAQQFFDKSSDIESLLAFVTESAKSV